MLITVDPGKKGAGVAVFEDRELTYASFIKGVSWFDTAFAIHCYLQHQVPKELLKTADLVIEKMVVRLGRNINPNDSLVPLLLMSGAIAGMLDIEPVEYKPEQWKGQAPKEIIKDRVIEKLSKEEISRIEFCRAKSLHHNIYDAIGIGHYHLSRKHVRSRKK